MFIINWLDNELGRSLKAEFPNALLLETAQLLEQPFESDNEGFRKFRNGERGLYYSMDIHSSVDIGSNVVIGNWVALGRNSFVEAETRIGGDCTIGAGVMLESGATLRSNVKIGDHTTIGSGVVIGECSTVGGYNKIHSGTIVGTDFCSDHSVRIGVNSVIGNSVLLGSDVAIGAYAHLFSDTVLGSGITLERGATDAIDLGFYEEYRKALSSVGRVAYIAAGCRWFNLKDAKKHWKLRLDRPITRAMLLSATEIARQKGWAESEEEQFANAATAAGDSMAFIEDGVESLEPNEE